jgi:protein-S-isoprenylcysteine O-methyltransferase Ste14
LNQSFFHVAFVIVFLGFTVIRAFYHRQAQRVRGRAEYREGWLHVGLRLVFGLPFIAAVFVYMAWPPLLGFAQFALPAWLQWIGLALGAASLLLIWWVQWALDANFSTVLHVRAEHTLVSHGPYRWVRHPMYTVLYLNGLAALLLSSNWLIGGFFLIALTLIVVTRLAREEAAMIEKFGDAYREYMGRTGRFLPRLA